MQGRASCRRCGTEVRAEIETLITCQGCGRKFQIPNEPQYYLTPLLQELQKVPLMAIADLIDAQNSGDFTPEFQFKIRPVKLAIICKPISPIPIAHWKATIRQFQQFTLKRIQEMTRFAQEKKPILGVNRYIEKLRERLVRLTLLP